MLSLPNNHEVFVRQVRLRSENLIKFGIWDGIEINDFKLWLKNFSTEEEQYFSARLLDAFIYRSNEQVNAMIFELFSRKIPNILFKRSGKYQHNLITKLSKKQGGIDIRVSTIVTDGIAQSGHVILRELKRNWLDKRYIIKPTECFNYIESGTQTFVFFDDFCGTGEQIKGFIKNNKLDEYSASVNIVFALLCAHETGLNYLKKLFPNILFTSSEVILKDYSCFDTVQDLQNSKEDFKNFYLNFLSSRGIRISKMRKEHRFGRGNLEIAYAFQQSVPNNTLGIIYYDETFNPLVRR